MIFFTSDTHFSHQNILSYCDRPFNDTDEMDEAIIANWNRTVSPHDTVYHLGDIALGPIATSLPKVARLNGHKIAILGNHDRPFMRAGKPDEQKWWNAYDEVFEEVHSWTGAMLTTDEGVFNVSHFPYTGDHTPEDRHSNVRMRDDGVPLIHGHTHTTDRLTFSSKGTPQIHVGQDAWEYKPVPMSTIVEILRGANAQV